MNFRKIIFLLGAMILCAAPTAFAEDATSATASAWGSIGAALAIGLAAFGGSLGQAKTAAAALEGIGRNPAAQGKIFLPMIIGLALIESLVLYAFVIAFIKIKT